MIFLKRRALMTRASFNYKTVSGIGSAVLENCVETKFKRLELSGNSKQTTTKGINLLPFKVWEKIISSDEKCEAVMKKDGVDITIKAGSVNDVISDIYFIGNGNGLGGDESAYELFKEGDYTFINNTNNQLYLFVIVWRNGEKKILIQGSRVILNNFTINKNDKVRIFLRPSNTLQTYFLEKASVMLCKHTETNLPYEPYTGGKPSPSPEYTQEIESAGDDGQIDVKVTGKNLFDISQYDKYDDTWTNTTYTTKKLNLKPNTTYTMSCKRLVDKPKQYVIFNIISGIKTGKAISVQINPSLQLNYFTGKGTFTTGETGEIVLNYYVDCPKDQYWFTEVIGDIQIELGSVQTPYEPYHEPQTVQLQLDEPLRGICENKDVVTKDSIIRKVKEIIFDENAEFIIDTGEIQIKTTAFISPVISDASSINLKPCRMMCDRFKVLVSGFDTLDEECCVLYNKRFIFRLNKERADTVDKLKEWLKQNPIKIQYLLQEPVLEPFENSLDSLHANDGTTVINVDSGEVETGIEVEYAVKN